MNKRGHGMLRLSLALFLVATGLRAGDNSDVMLVDSTTVLASLKLGQHDQNRILAVQTNAPKDHKIEVECQTVAPGGEAIRHIIRITPMNAAGKPDGEEQAFVDWYRRSSRTAEYRDGVKQGMERQYEVESGALLSETPWDKGRIQGVKRTFHPTNGKLANESTYEKGVIVGQSRSASPEGGVIRVVNYADGKRDGESIDYWPDKPDAVQRIIPYKKDQVEGLAKGFYLNGKIKWERPFRDNQQHGVEKLYSAEGAVEKTIYWLKGSIVTEEEYRKQAKE